MTNLIFLDDDPMARPMRDNQNDQLSMFYSDLGTYGRIKPAGERGSDERVEREKMANTTLHRFDIVLLLFSLITTLIS